MALANGYAMSIAALALHALEQWPTRLAWCVDLQQIGVAEIKGNVTDPMSDKVWGPYLVRLKVRLDEQPHVGQTCGFCMHVKQIVGSHKQRVCVSYRIPGGVAVWFLAGGSPPVGSWLLERDPNEDGASHDLVPDPFWLEEIPF